MTALRKPVTRSTKAGRIGFLITLRPGDPALIEVWERRRGAKHYVISVAHLHTLLALREASIPMRRRKP